MLTARKSRRIVRWFIQPPNVVGIPGWARGFYYARLDAIRTMRWMLTPRGVLPCKDHCVIGLSDDPVPLSYYANLATLAYIFRTQYGGLMGTAVYRRVVWHALRDKTWVPKRNLEAFAYMWGFLSNACLGLSRKGPTCLAGDAQCST